MTASNSLRALIALLALLAGLGQAHAQTLSPLHLGVQRPVSNEYGLVLSGTALQPGCAVRVLWATNGIYPPAVDGTPNPSNAPVTKGQCGIGYLTSPYVSDSGLFGLLIHPRPAGGQLFVRAFNHADPAQATFYADSPVMTVSTAAMLPVELGATTNALDPADDDEDGLNNSWEKSYGSNSSAADTDGDGLTDLQEHEQGLSPVRADSDLDGVNDGHEVRAGTDALNPGSYLGMAMVQPQQDDLLLQWASVTGKLYQVEDATGDLLQPLAFSNITEVIPAADGPLTSAVITNGLQAPGLHFFRIRLVEE